MQRVAVTGATGKQGRAVVDLLTREGYDVMSLDVTPPRIRNEKFSKVDFTDYGQTLDALLGIDSRHSGFDALVHLAAVPGAGHLSDVETFHNNMTVTFNVFQAARRASIKNIVYASSETLLGLPFKTDPPYLPVDEEYASRPESIYSLVKHLEETMAIEMTRWDPALKIVGLRLSNVMDESDYQRFPSFDSDLSLRDWNLWAYIDHRDGAHAVLQALLWDAIGFDTFNIAADDSVMNRPSAELAAQRFPTVPLKHDLKGNDSLMSSGKAKRILGYAPQHSWRDVV
ncbi:MULTISPECIES: NAD(P)-dependent oxidoreductase [Arthrobacter]|uniref:NAD(P)-dependent oxidoreductase n=1 Tax=Arthrobacter terricola TaxID=2547396 RepID=A0A4R5K794_9MICC|nr:MULTISPECIES: NAD(P)-dependent oxidoreductase [Arthrobacter]MBT8163463.1 NAD(P)-dependent oxidoreductase [Arthrobacter sp. GN70]TDF89763.1 NAD(P)-dependent oxidoreductase [Arthrobacter terricola]